MTVMAHSAPALEIAPAPLPVPTQTVLGVPLALTDYGRTLNWIDASITARRPGYICVAAVHTVMASQEDPDLREAVLASDLTVPDGQPLVWAMNLLGHSLPSRVYGPDLLYHACVRAAPFRELSELEAAETAAVINASGADVVWVGLGVPLQEKWMARMRERLEAPVLVGVGAAFDFHAGVKKQAPNGLQRLGLEWAFRLFQEPRRLWRRYLHYNPRFVTGFARQYLRHLRAHR